MPVVVWLSKFVALPIVKDVLWPAAREALAKFFESHAAAAENKAAVVQAKAASTLAENANRAEALREASKKLSDITARR